MAFGDCYEKTCTLSNACRREPGLVFYLDLITLVPDTPRALLSYCALEPRHATPRACSFARRHCERYCGPDFVKRRRGRVMMVSSVTAAAPIPTVASYAASKSYLTRSDTVVMSG